ncbi:MAG: Gfo/Idh/MocA family oxidoreductase [Planctomycetaceae bacterium]
MDMIGIGVIGIGFMGMTHFEGARRLNGGKVVAISTRNPQKLAGDWSSIQGNFGPPGSAETDLTGIECYADYHALLADESVSLVDICLPTDRHEQVVIEALEAGKHARREANLN